jgi:uncharacterized membrane protein
MKGCSKWSGMAHWKTAVSLIFVATLLAMSAHAQESGSSAGQSLILNVYLDSAGKALVTGYAEDISGLAFLKNAQFRIENDSHQLYALTDDLTAKVGDLWTLSFDSKGRFDDYRVTFYLPSETSLGEINTSQGLGYLLSASNESLVADVQGWEVSDPRISIQYQQPLAANGSNLPSAPPLLPGGYPDEGAALIMLLIAAALMVAGFGFAVFLQRKRRGSTNSPIENKMAGTIEDDNAAGPVATASLPDKPDIAGPQDLPSAAAQASSSLDEDSRLTSAPEDDGVFLSEASHTPLANEPGRIESAPSQVAEPTEISQSESLSTKNSIVVSSEMEAVMQTLTARERAVMSTLIDHGGRMTQADIRYETGTPKSSLTGILISLERRKLVSKKEWGRTNIIELSDWFLSKKERS